MAKGFHSTLPFLSWTFVDKKSKRKGLKQKHKVIRKVRENKRKLRKEFRKMKAAGIYRKSEISL